VGGAALGYAVRKRQERLFGPRAETPPLLDATPPAAPPSRRLRLIRRGDAAEEG
jgi:hypothetical protein